jgi:hypothetical protein
MPGCGVALAAAVGVWDAVVMSSGLDGRDVAIGAAVVGARAGLAVARLALLPVRLAARVPVAGAPLRRASEGLQAEGRQARFTARRRLETVGAEEAGKTADRVLAGPLVEALARSIVAHRVVERAAEEALQEGAGRDVSRVLESPRLLELTDDFLRSEEMQRVVEHVASSPELRRALARQSSGLAGELAVGVRTRTESLDDAAERKVCRLTRRPPRTTQ